MRSIFLFALLVCTLSLYGQQPTTTGSKKALLLGPGSFAGEKRYWIPLSTELDIEYIKRGLIKQGFQNADITSITGQMATRNNILAEFRKFISSLQDNDIVYVHFTGHGYLSEIDGESKFAIPAYDFHTYYFSDPSKTDYKSAFHNGSIQQKEIEDFIQSVQQAIGVQGQVLVTMDVSHSGRMVKDAIKELEKNKRNNTVSARGESKNFITNLVSHTETPTVIITGTSEDEVGFEVKTEDGKGIGPLSYALYKVFSSTSTDSIYKYKDIFQKVRQVIQVQKNRQTPQMVAFEDYAFFRQGKSPKYQSAKKQSGLSGNVFTISVGINDYKGGSENLAFANCASDAKRYSVFFKEQFENLNTKYTFTDRLMVNETATRSEILKAINEAISATAPGDYFIFNFAGYCIPLPDSTGKQVTYFVPYGLKNISDTLEIREKGISLTVLKDLLQMIPANNQLFVTEAGPTEHFQKEFIQALIETDPRIAFLTNKNRVFIIPKSFGLDNFVCGNDYINQGPINYYLTTLKPDQNIFGLFQGGKVAAQIKYALNNTEIKCENFTSSYFDIFFEKEYLKDLELFMPAGLTMFRGAGVERDVKNELKSLDVKKYALVIGTDKYPSSTWSALPNAVLDAVRIAKELKEGFDYNVTLLVNQPADSIYAAIKKLSAVLQPNDQLVVYASGHGDFDDKFMDDGFIVCTDSRDKKTDPFRNSYIPYSKLSRMINRLPAKQVLMLLDVCFGGSFDEKAVRNKGRGDVYDDVADASYFTEKMKLKTRLYLSSGGKNVVPDGYAGKHSPFAHRLLQAFQEKGGPSKMITSSNLFEFVKKLPSGPVLGSFGDDDLNTEFVLIAK